jgi:hypothetical protein
MEQEAGRLHFGKTALWGAGQLNGSFDEHRSDVPPKNWAKSEFKNFLD